MQHVLFIGAGEMGTALAQAIEHNAVIEKWDKNGDRTPGARSLEESVPRATVIFLCVPSWAMREVLVRISPSIRPNTIVISLAKGIEEKSTETMDVMLQKLLPANQAFGILGGPLLAKEIVAHLPSVGVFAATSHKAFNAIAPLFANSCVRLEYAQDPHGVALAAVLKNVYAVALGIADGLGWGWNGKGWLAARALKEIEGILACLHVQSSLVLGSAGAGDFLATALSPDSHNTQAGREIALSGTCKIPSEGCRAIPLVRALLKEHAGRFAFLLSLERIVVGQEDPKAVFQDVWGDL